MFDWDDVPDDIANYVAVEQLSSEEETTEVQPAAEPAKEEQRRGQLKESRSSALVKGNDRLFVKF